MKKSIILPINQTSGALMTLSKGVAVNEVWKWGSDNLLPVALANLARQSATHRRIINDKADYIAGRGFSADESNPRLDFLVKNANGQRETLRNVLQKVAFDKCLFGNAFVEIVTDSTGSFLSLYHQDASKCRLSKDRKYVVLHHDWSKFKKGEAAQISLYPLFTKMTDGTLRAMLHYKDYEPMAENYGLPKYIAALGAASIAYKTDRWNVSRLDNSFQPSGIMVLDGEVDTEEEAVQIARQAEKKFAGKPGQVMFIVKNAAEGDTTKFVPLTAATEGDWRGLHEQATYDIVVAHSWFITLSGLNYSTGFSAERIINEYNIALNSVITVEQSELIEPIKTVVKKILGTDCSSLAFINKPPFSTKAPYMRIWEARREDGLDYDPEDAAEQAFIGR
ncbi:hypothetical protein BN938_1468 [Mucinivorans hirudinis]|uniref:Phage portal protein n=1 Tax=Mucinivorans hirudinis TaxID=1433126 RepID=A0A060R844_9BACT|nr:hypothetical protein BN938_1468 [Mucinivorans hirudinis]